MTRKIIILFAVLTLCFYSLISSFLGERGFIANNQLKRQLKENEYKLDKSDVEIEMLTRQEAETQSEDGRRSTAMNLGYKVDGDEVYVFDTKDEVEVTETSHNVDEEQKNNSFKPLRPSFILLISVGASFIICLLALLLRRHKGEEDDPQQEESGDTGNYLGDN